MAIPEVRKYNISNFETVLKQKLYRFNCPDPSLLRDYAWGYLAVLQSKAVDNHLKMCELCSAEVAEQKAVISSPISLVDQLHQIVKKVRVVVAQLLKPEDELAMRLAFRGAEDDRSFWYEADEMLINLSWQLNQFGRFTVVGQALMVEADPSDSVLELKINAESASQTQLDENGAFIFLDVKEGVYELTLTLPEQQIVIPVVQVSN